jgi:hypothetical protein
VSRRALNGFPHDVPIVTSFEWKKAETSLLLFVTCLS